MRNKSLIVIGATLLLLTACSGDVIFDKSKEIGGDAWNSSDVVKFTVPVTDTLAWYNFYITVRNTTDYPYSNLYVFLKTFYPKGQISVDTLECFLAEADGNWLGKRRGSMVDHRILLQRTFRFVQSGTYSFEFEQAMRVNPLPGIRNFGIRIEKVKPEKQSNG